MSLLTILNLTRYENSQSFRSETEIKTNCLKNIKIIAIIKTLLCWKAAN